MYMHAKYGDLILAEVHRNLQIHKTRLYLFVLSRCRFLANGQLDVLYIIIILYVGLGQADRDVKDTDRGIYMLAPGLCS